MDSFIEIFVKITGINIIRYFVIAGVFFFTFYLLLRPKLQHLKIQLKEASLRDFLREILHSIQTTLVFGVISLVVLFSPLSSYTQMYQNIHEYPIWWIPVSLLLGLVLHDTYFYWMHRLMHHKTLYKKIHLVHHQSTNPSPWAAYSFHFLEAIIEGLVIIPIVMLIPMHLLTISLFITTSFIINVYGHLGFEIVPVRFRNSRWFKILNTSIYHNMHHSHVKGNYSLYFRHWDRWMKTENTQYEKYFDQVIDRRASTRENTSAGSDLHSGFKKTITLSILMLSMHYAEAQIEGKWQMTDRNVLIEVYKKDKLFYGKVVKSDNYAENVLLQTRDIYLFEGMRLQENEKVVLWNCLPSLQKYTNPRVCKDKSKRGT